MLQQNIIYNFDCIDFLKKINKESIDLAIIDPPYNILNVKWDYFENREKFFKFTFNWIDNLIPTLKSNASLYIFNTPFNSAFILQYLISKNLKFQNWITWDKRDGFNASKRKYVTAQETILFFTKGNNYTFNYNDIRIPYQSTERINHAKKKGILKNGKRWFPNPKGKLCTEIWHISSERHKQKINGKVQKLFHCTQKPIDLIERIVKASSNKNDVILDCFVGSGTTALACLKLDRNFLCNDKNKSYFNYANERISNYGKNK
jgi:site-specific DNA-methyltransferase (adenine-specific)